MTRVYRRTNPAPASSERMMEAPHVPRGYRLMFLGAALYNLLWGTSALLFPLFAFTAIGAEPPRYPPLVQCIGMMVAVYAVGYFLLFKDPLRYAPLVWVGVLGKTFGPIGFVWSAWSGQLPWDFGWHLLLNDLIWLPGFWLFAWKYARRI